MSAVTVVDLTMVDNPSKIVHCDANDKCPVCWDPVEDGKAYFSPPCGHVHCRGCMADSRLHQCGRCSQPFSVAEQVLVNIPNSTYDLTDSSE